MLRRDIVLGVVVLGIGIAAAGRPGEGARGGGTRLVSWIPYWDQAEGLRAYDAYGPALEEVTVFAYHFDQACRVTPASPWVPEAARQLKAASRGSRTLISVVNDVVRVSGPPILKDPQCIHQLLADPDERARHVEELAALAAPVDGLEIDYENLWSRDRELFSELVAEAAQRLHAQGKTLAVDVMPKTSDHRRNGAGAMDWPALARHADQVRVMAYHLHYPEGPPGPLAPPDWVAKITDLAQAQIPSDKLVMVLTLNGFDWPEGEAAKPVEYAQAMRNAPAGTVWKRDRSSGAYWSRYVVDGTPHEVWLEDGECVVKKIHLLRQAGVTWIGLWHLGAGDEVVEQAVNASGGG